MTAQEKLEKINSALENGKTVYIQTYTHSIEVTRKTVQTWKNAGRDFFRISKNSLYMASGKKYLCIDFNGIAIQ